MISNLKFLSEGKKEDDDDEVASRADDKARKDSRQRVAL